MVNKIWKHKFKVFLIVTVQCLGKVAVLWVALEICSFINNWNIYQWCEEPVQYKQRQKGQIACNLPKSWGRKRKSLYPRVQWNDGAPQWRSHEDHPAGDGPFFSSLHMGHCCPNTVVIQKQASWSGTCLKVKFGLKVMSGEPLLGMPHMLVLHVIVKGEKWQRRAATCHTLYRKESDNTNQAPSAFVVWKNWRQQSMD